MTQCQHNIILFKGKIKLVRTSILKSPVVLDLNSNIKSRSFTHECIIRVQRSALREPKVKQTLRKFSLMVFRDAPACRRSLCFTKDQMKILINFERQSNRKQLHLRSSCHDFVVAFAHLSGYLARSSDPPSGHLILWRAMMRFKDIQVWC